MLKSVKSTLTPLLLVAHVGLCYLPPPLPLPTPPGRLLLATLGGTRSHTTPLLALGRALAARGHNVTVLSAFPPASDNGGGAEDYGVQQLNPLPLVRYVAEFTRDWDLLGARARGEEPVPAWDVIKFGLQVCDATLGSEVVRALLESGDPPTLVVADGAFPDCLLGLAHRLGAPHMLLNTVAAHPGAVSWAAASPAPFSVTPFMGAAHTDHMSLPQRMVSAACHTIMRAMHVLTTKLLLEPCMRRHLGPDVPSVSALSRNTSFVLQNGLSAATLPRAYFPDVAEVGCLHCRPARPLPQDLEHFVSGSPSGFVLVSMGSGVRAANMPAPLRSLMMAAFSRLPYRVLWKYEEGDEPGTPWPQINSTTMPTTRAPANVMLKPWLPQQDLLGHPQLRAFVGHGGLLSVLEAAYHGAPLVALPVFCDHDANAAKAEADGYAAVLQLRGLTATKLADTVRTVATDNSFREAARRRSVLVRDLPIPPLDVAVFWTEYVLRHRGDTRHLQSAARHLSWWQFYGFDLFAIMLLIISLSSVIFNQLRRLLNSLRWTSLEVDPKLKVQ